VIDETSDILLVPTIYRLFLGDLKKIEIPAITPLLFFDRGTDIFGDTRPLGNGLERKQTASRPGTLNRKAVTVRSESRPLHKTFLI
jgi:hypothetical protein